MSLEHFPTLSIFEASPGEESGLCRAWVVLPLTSHEHGATTFRAPVQLLDFSFFLCKV